MRNISDFIFYWKLFLIMLSDPDSEFLSPYAIVNLRECIRGYPRFHKVQEHRWGGKYLKINIMWNNVRPNQNDVCHRR